MFPREKKLKIKCRCLKIKLFLENFLKLNKGIAKIKFV